MGVLEKKKRTAMDGWWGRLAVALAATVVVMVVLVGVSGGFFGVHELQETTLDAELSPLVTSSMEVVPENASTTDAEIQAPAVDTPTTGGEGVTYDFTAPAIEGEMVDMSWFADAVFIGDSRTEGLYLYSGITGSTFLYCKGITIFDVVDDPDKKIIYRDGTYYTVLEALTLGEYTKVYISLGINELGYFDDQKYHDAMVELIDQVRAIQPTAVIYLQTIVPINPELAAERSQPYYVNNTRIEEYNTILRTIAVEEEVVLLDIDVALTDEEGILPYDASSDGIHYVKAWYERWRDYLMTHTVDATSYFANQT